MGRIMLACYRPKPGKVKALHDLVRTHVDRLREEGTACRMIHARNRLALVDSSSESPGAPRAYGLFLLPGTSRLAPGIALRAGF